MIQSKNILSYSKRMTPHDVTYVTEYDVSRPGLLQKKYLVEVLITSSFLNSAI